MTAPIGFFCPGRPQTAGSKTAVPTPAGPRVLDGGSKQVREAKRSWRGDLRDAAVQATTTRVFPVFPTGPLALTVVIVRKRPSTQIRTGRNAGVVKDACAGLMPVQRPDSTKILRAAEDALTGVLWGDDSQLVRHTVHKAFADQVGLPVVAEGLFVHVGSCLGYLGPQLQTGLAA